MNLFLRILTFALGLSGAGLATLIIGITSSSLIAIGCVPFLVYGVYLCVIALTGPEVPKTSKL